MSIKLVFSIMVILCLKLSLVRAAAVEPALVALLKQQVDFNEGVQIQQILPVELDDSVAGAEKAVLWTVIGPTYWRNQLSILANQSGRLKVLATITILGETIGFGPVKPDGTLQVETRIGAPIDPLCCPTQLKQLDFRYRDGQLSAVIPHPE